MRIPAAAVLLVACLLAGCSGQGPSAPGPAEGLPASGGSPETGGPLPRLAFGVPSYDQATTFDGAFDNPDPCSIGVTCAPAQLDFDLTPLVPAGAPVELAIEVVTDTCVFPYLDVTEASLYRYSLDSDAIAAVVVRGESGSVRVGLEHCSTLGGEPGSSSRPVSVEVRSVVRADVVPPFLPVVLALRPGDRIEAMGASAGDLEDVVVVPPGGDAIHLLDQPVFNVTDGMPAGDYVVLVKGAEAMLHGPNVTLRPARVDRFVGEDRPLASGEPMQWVTAVPGIPAFATLQVMTGTSGSIEDPDVSYNNGYAATIRQAGRELAATEQAGCVIPCQVNGPGGQFTRTIGTGFFPEGLGLGDLEFSVSNEMGRGMHVREVVGYLVID